MKSLMIFMMSVLVSSLASANFCYKTKTPVSGINPRLCFSGYGFHTNGSFRELLLTKFDNRKDLSLDIVKFDPCETKNAQGGCIAKVVGSEVYLDEPGTGCERAIHAEIAVNVALDMDTYVNLPNDNDLSSVSEIESIVISGTTQVDTCHSPVKKFEAVYTRE